MNDSDGPSIQTNHRIPTLDGWRGIAILLVMIDHTQSALLGGYLQPWMQTGQHGVTIFFVLSGFLITSKLIEVPINFRDFYIRRFFRLMPAAWAYLAAVGMFGLVYGQHWLSFRELASCVFFYRNFIGQESTNFAGHFWSLSMEEQFYLLWPCLLLVAGIRKSKWFALAGALGCASYRFFNWSHYSKQWLSFETQVRADALLVGCLLALLLTEPRIRSLAVRWSKLWALPATASLLLAIYRFQWLPPLFECVAIAGLIATSTLHPRWIFARPLAFTPLAWLGTVSYSIYVWQQFFFADRGRISTIPMICVMPLFALGSYYWIERPATRLGHRLTIRFGQRAHVSTFASTAHLPCHDLDLP
jgi:peptidoglycan/LPS O-acetylase OafA/YrhL